MRTAALFFSRVMVVVILTACNRNLPEFVSALYTPAIAGQPTVTGMLLPPTPPPTAALQAVGLVTVNVNVRQGPGTDFEVIGLLVAGSEVTLRGQTGDGNWRQISYPSAPDGLGWVAAEFVQTPQAGHVPIVSPNTPEPEVKTSPGLPATATQRAASTSTPLPYRLAVRLIPEAIYPGACARLGYELENLAQARLNDNPLPARPGQDSLIVCPTQETTYLLSGVASNGEVVSRTITLKVIPATPTTPVEGGSILAAMTRGCQFALETLGTAGDTLCRFSPDGGQIAAPAADGSLWVIGVEGKTFQQVVNPVGRFLIGGDVVWSPDGASLAFSAVGLDGLGSGVGYYQFAAGSLAYLGPDAQSGRSETAAWPRWTQDGRLIMTWYREGEGTPAILTPDGPLPLAEGEELWLSAGTTGQQVYPWKAGQVWVVGESPPYVVDY